MNSPVTKTRECEFASGGVLLDAAGHLAALRPHLRAHGITRVGELTELDVIGIPVAFAARPNSRSLSVSQGKSLDSAEAQLGAVMEGLEQAFAEREESLVHARCSAAELRAAGLTPIDLERIARAVRVPGSNETVSWTRATSIVTGATVYVPFELVGLDLRVDAGRNATGTQVSSVGLAAGRSWEAAATHALLEVLEHDATAAMDFFGFMPGLAKPVAYRDGTSASLDALTARIEAAGLSWDLFDISSANGLPVIAAVIEGDDLSEGASQFGGYACRFSAEHAAEAALLEAVQSRLTVIAGARDDLKLRHYTGGAPFSKMIGERRQLHELPRTFAHLRARPPREQFDAAVLVARRYGAQDIVVAHLGGIDGLVAVVRVVVAGVEASGFNALTKLGQRTIEAFLGGGGA